MAPVVHHVKRAGGGRQIATYDDIWPIRAMNHHIHTVHQRRRTQFDASAPRTLDRILLDILRHVAANDEGRKHLGVGLDVVKDLGTHLLVILLPTILLVGERRKQTIALALYRNDSGALCKQSGQ